MADKIQAIFEKHFATVGSEVRPEQRRLIEPILQGRNALGLMPTGSGKSLCYWIAGKGLGGITLVISPLMALMDEQAKKLNDIGCLASVLHSGIDGKKQTTELLSIYNGKRPDFIFLSPERLATDGFLEFVLHHVRDEIRLLVVDEAHCISQWGLDFRPFYKEIPPFIEHIFKNSPRPLLLGLTATLNPKDVAQMCADFSIAASDVLLSSFLVRHDLKLDSIKVATEDEKDTLFWRKMDENKGEKLLVYVDRREGKRSTEDLCSQAKANGHEAEFFHAGLSSQERAEVIERFKTNKTKVVFATNAFGMGIDIPDIRGVIHYLLPESVEQYYQQIGRAGRDQKGAWATLFYSDKNIQVRKRHFIEKSLPDAEDILKGFQILSNSRVGKVTFNLFSEGEKTQSAFHYLIRHGAARIECKAVQNVSVFDVTKGQVVPEFLAMKAATRTGIFLKTAKTMGLSERECAKQLYQWLADGKIHLKSAPTKCLVIESNYAQLPENILEAILKEIASVKSINFGDIDSFVALLDGFENSTKLHQEIGLYLGVDKFSLGKIYETLAGHMVRSKSEVIIDNLLHERKIPFYYERPIKISGQQYSPDFTIEWKGKTFYWEHLGRLDDESYSESWRKKKNMYDTHYPDQLLTTMESSRLSKDAEDLIHEKFV